MTTGQLFNTSALATRNLWLMTASWDLDLRTVHISTKDNNIADALSRIYSDKLPSVGHLANLIGESHWEEIPISYFLLNTEI